MQEFHTAKNSGSMTITVFGALIRIKSNDPEALDTVLRFLPPGSQIMEGYTDLDVTYHINAGTKSSLYRTSFRNDASSKDTIIEGVDDLKTLLLFLESDIHFQVACHARSALFIHAGVVAYKKQAICLPGRSYTGKSSLVNALIQAGASYYSDEFAPLDANGHVHPYPKPLYLRNEQGYNISIPLKKVTGNIGKLILPVGMVIHTRYKPDGKWHPQSITPGEAILAIVDNTVLARKYPHQVLETAGKVASNAFAFASSRGEAKIVADWILYHLDSCHDKG